MSSINLELANSRLNPCKKCGYPGDFCIRTTEYHGDIFSGRFCVSVRCLHCNAEIDSNICGYFSIESEIDKLTTQWNKENDIPFSTIDTKLQGFDEDQKSLVCILLYLAGYKFTPEDLSKYVQHSSINIRETFADMTLEQKSKAFVMIGQTLGYLPEGGNKNGWN